LKYTGTYKKAKIPAVATRLDPVF